MKTLEPDRSDGGGGGVGGENSVEIWKKFILFLFNGKL